MKTATAITCLFLDIGGVLLTNGWDHQARKRAAAHFKLAWAEMEERHQLTFETYEIENTPMFVRIAEGLGIRSILQTDYRFTCAALASFGLQNDEGVIHEAR